MPIWHALRPMKHRLALHCLLDHFGSTSNLSFAVYAIILIIAIRLFPCDQVCADTPAHSAAFCMLFPSGYALLTLPGKGLLSLCSFEDCTLQQMPFKMPSFC